MEWPKPTNKFMARARNPEISIEYLSKIFGFKKIDDFQFKQKGEDSKIILHPLIFEKNSLEPVFEVKHLKVFLKGLELNGYRIIEQPKRFSGIGTLSRVSDVIGMTFTIMEEE